MRIGAADRRRERSAASSGPRRAARVIAILALLAVGSGALLLSGVVLYASVRPALIDLTGRVRSADAARSLWRVPYHLLAALTGPPVERIHIDIGFKRMQRLREKRDEALRLGVLMNSDGDFVSASIRHGERVVPVRIRLKGDWTDHLAGDKWSLRVHVRKGDQILGMRRFSIQNPATRGYQAEPILFAHLRREGVLAPRYSFVQVAINGKDIGLMALEEHCSKELLESQQRPEGVILHFDEEVFWRSRASNGTFGPYGNPWVSTIRPFGPSQIAESPRLAAQLELGTGLLRGFLAGALPAASVFDVELAARFLALAETWNTRHLLAWHNLRFYLNPITARLEPVGFDASLQSLDLDRGLVSRLEPVTSRLLDDPELRLAFVHNLARIASEMADGSLAAWVAEVERPLLRILHREFPLRAPLDLAPLAARAATLAKITPENFAHFEPYLGSPELEHPHPLRAYVYPSGEGAVLELVNSLPVPVTVTLLRSVAGDGSSAIPLAVEPAPPLILPPTPFLGRPEPVRLELPRGNDSALRIEGEAAIAGHEAIASFRAEPYAPPRARPPIPPASADELVARHSFLAWDPSTRTLHAAPGRWDVEGSLVLPEGAGLELPAGTTLCFGRGEALIASGPLRFAGLADHPIVLEGCHAAGGDGTWAGIVVLRSDEPVAWAHTRIRNTTGVDRDGWSLTGGVTLRASEVAIADSRFEGSRAEDALNLILSRFRLENVDFADTESDAIDSDFADGTIRGGRFARIGGDGIDVSGARVEIDGVRLEGVRDKAISVGEGSEVTARTLDVERVGTAAASKDRSRLLIESSRISQASFAGVMAYTKKPEFGPSEAIVRNVAMHAVARPAIAQTGSRLLVDGHEVEGEEIDVDQLYETGAMRK